VIALGTNRMVPRRRCGIGTEISLILMISDLPSHRRWLGPTVKVSVVRLTASRGRSVIAQRFNPLR
jgi:hypothetical protein